MTTKNILKYFLAIGTSLLFASTAFAANVWMGEPILPSTHAHVEASTTAPKPNARGLMQIIKTNIHDGMQDERMNMATTGSDMKGPRFGGGKIASTTIDNRDGTKDNIKNDRTDMHVNMQMALQNMRIIQMAQRAWIRINATIVRLTKIVAKLDSRIAKIKTVGGDTRIAESDSADAKTALGKAATDMNDVKSILGSLSSTTPLGTATSTIKSDNQDAETQLKTTQSDIEKAVQSLENVSAGLQINEHASVEASSTEGTH